MSAWPRCCWSHRRSSNAGLGAVFINLSGLTGAAIAATATLIVWNIAMAIFISRQLQLRPGILGLRREPAERKVWQSI